MLALDFQSRLPIYEQLYKSITQMAALDVLEKGKPLPSVRALAQELGINPNTVQKTYSMLEHDGIIYSVPGKGSFLSSDVSALEKQKKLVSEQLRGAVRSAVECGMTKEEIITRVTAAFDERGVSE